ncbi:MAG: chitobiase/beta-hexosaminidase C-terminal domain-containing protein [Lachnospiraceae bacterium]|nr:chitobiase/beta-hexosaminidase C-terminal domain-containing protein [Lachnospiraceae bacterium]
MGKLASKLTKRIMAVALSTAMILSNMTVYASELSGPVQQTEETVENTETDVVELPSTEDETANDETSQDEVTQDETTSGEDSNEAPDGAEEGEESVPEETDEEIPDAEEASSEEVEAEEPSEVVDEPAAVAAGDHTLWLVGDSTVCEFKWENYFYRRYGYGTQIYNYLDETYTVRNLAISGRSSKSFLSETNYQTLLAGMKDGDVLVIGFGHNDEKDDATRYTNPNGNYTVEGSFAYTLYENYVKEAQKKNTKVILCTPIVRRGTGKTLSNSECHITSDKPNYPGGDYPKAIRELGSTLNIPVVDLTAATKKLYETLGPDETLYLHAWTGGLSDDEGNPGSVDNTHLNNYGAKRVAYLFAEAIYNAVNNPKDANDALLGELDIANHINISAGVPTKDELEKNETYKKPVYSSPVPDDAKFPSYTLGEGVDAITFHATVFGTTGGASKINDTNFTFETLENGDMHIVARSGGGTKITAGTPDVDGNDGFAMYYYQIPAKQKFKFSAKATLNEIADKTQSAFGLMARDDMYINTNDNTILSDYVVAGTFGDGGNCFYRLGKTFGGKTAFTKGTTISAEQTYDLSIVDNGEGYECTFGNEDTQSGGYDFRLISVDSDYVYVGMFATRATDVTFSDIHLELEEIPGTYAIDISTDGNGTAKASRSSADEGDDITLTASPKLGYQFKEWQVLSNNVTIKNDQFTMPADNVSIKAIFEEKPKTIEVWDFGAKEESDAKYTNYITATAYNDANILTGTGGKFEDAVSHSFGDLTMVCGNGDILYTDIEGLDGLSADSYHNEYEDYTAGGGWYCNGTSNSSRRYLTIANVNAGDKIVAYMGNTGTADTTFYFKGPRQTDEVDAPAGKFQKYEFVAQYSGTYTIGENNAGKPMYQRIVRIPAVIVTGAIDFGKYKLPDGYSVKFVNQTTKVESTATIEADGTFTVLLAPGYTYRVVLKGAMGYGFTSASSTLVTTDDEALTGKNGVTLVVEEKTTYLFSGTIKGFAEGYNLDNLSVVMTPSEDSDAFEIELDIDKTGDKPTFRADLEPDVEYSIVLNGVNDYRVLSPLVVKKEDEGTSYENRTISVALKPTYDVVGGFIGLDENVNVTLKFVNVDDEYTYDAAVANGGYSIKLRDGEYLAQATVTGYKTSTHVVVNGGSISRDLFFVSTADKAKTETYKPNIYVGYSDQSDKTPNYATVREAMEACEVMNRPNNERITVHIAPGTYREQIIVKAPNISFVNDEPNKEVKLTWYYGIGFLYYSVLGEANNRFYDPASAYDQYDKNEPDKWGATVYVTSSATAFQAEGITFENSFNREITDEELEDGVELSPAAENVKAGRNYNTDVESKANTERAAAIVIDADKSEFLNCGFYSSQDTFYSKGAHIYLKNCVIEGQTDYIFGNGNAVFDACELSWKGYSTGSQGGYITALQTKDGEKGYLFRNCTITANHYNNLEVKPGYFGRPWSQLASVVFMNTKLQSNDLILDAGWADWKPGNASEPTAANAKYFEYNTISLDGKSVNVDSRVRPVMSENDAKAINVSDYFGEWKPEYYAAEAETLEFTETPKVKDNGDENRPMPGHTLTVTYKLGDNDSSDASIIQWYMVESNADTEEGTLLKSSTATADKTYKIEEKAVGKYIKVTVTPQTISGKSGTSQSYIMEEAVKEGYEDPSSGSDIVMGDGINIFLAGDSTVKDYSPNGMYEKGQGENLGSWGEFLQSFFDESQVKIQNYANGGRTTKSFIEEGSLTKIQENIGEGDYLFIQFGHNDSADGTDKYVPLGDPDDSGNYPEEEGTFKGYLSQFINVARSKNATPVLITPVSRMYYESNGTIYAHHCVKADQHGEANTYVDAVKQLARDYEVDCIDAFDFTKELFEAAWKADGKNSNLYGTQLMAADSTKEDGVDKTHNNKLGGIIESLLMASAIQSMDFEDIPYAVKAPSSVLGTTTDGKEVFRINSSGVLTAYDINSGYTDRATYWEGIGQTMINDIRSKAEDLATNSPAGTLNAPKATPGSGTIKKGESVTLTVDTTVESTQYDIVYTTDGTDPKAEDVATETYETGGIPINKDTTIKAYTRAKEGTGLISSKVVTYVYKVTSAVDAPTAVNYLSGSAVPAGAAIKLQAATGMKIRYTMGTNPADPTVYSTLYDDTKGIVVTAATTIKAIAVNTDGDKSAVATFTYTVSADASSENIPAPEFDTPEGNVEIGTVVKLSVKDEAGNPVEGVQIYFTQGKAPVDPTVRNAELYDDEEGIVINKSATIKAIAVKGNSVSVISERTYTVPMAADPVANPNPGEVDKGTKVTLTSEGSKAIYYTLDKSDPRIIGNAARKPYEAAIVIDEDTTIKAYAVKDNCADSDLVTFIYKVKTTEGPGGNGGEDGDTSGLKITLDKEDKTYTYTGSAIKPPMTVTYNGKEISEGTDYTVKYSNNTKVDNGSKKPTITVKGKGNYSGSGTENFIIEKASLNTEYADGDILISGAVKVSELNNDNLSDALKIEDSELEGKNADAVMYVAKNAKLSPVIYYNGIKLGTKDYTLSKKDKWTASNVLTITGQNNFKDTLNIYVKVVDKSALKKITKVELKNTSFNFVDGFDTWTKQEADGITVYSGKEKVEAGKGNYIVEHYGDTINVGKVKVTVVGTGAYTGVVSKTYTIKPVVKDASKLKVKLGDAEVTASTHLPFISTGVTLDQDKENALTVSYVVDAETTVPLKLGVDYKITYSGNKKVGPKAKYTVTGLGNYKGLKKTGNFTIDAVSLVNNPNIEIVVPNPTFAKAKVYKAAPYVFETQSDGSKVLLKSSNYKLSYWNDDEAKVKITKSTNAGDERYVKIEGKGGYAAKGSDEEPYPIIKYTVKNNTIDLSKASLTFYDSASATAKATKLSYTGNEVKPAKVKIEVKSQKHTVTVILDENAAGYNDEANQELLSKLRIEVTSNVNKGKATVVVMPNATDEEGSYTGGKTGTFSIVAKKW